MKKTLIAFVVAVGMLVALPGSLAVDPNTPDKPRPVPIHRPEMKRLLEQMKERTPRIPLPEVTAQEQTQAAGDARALSYESRLRTHYLPDGDLRGYLHFAGSPARPTAAFRGFEPYPALKLDYRFKTMLFWIASRANNCQYCLGHQESKLLAAGLLEDDIAALDSDWSRFSAAEQAALALAKKLTLEPHLLTAEDIASCQAHYTDLQIIEMLVSVAGNNAINRWKEGLGVPQSAGGGNFGGQLRDGAAAANATQEHTYLTETSEAFQSAASFVAPVLIESGGSPTCDAVCKRPPLEDFATVKRRLDEAATRTALLPVADEAATRLLLPEAEAHVCQWMRLLAHFPEAGKRTIASIQASEQGGSLSPLLKAQVSWAVARHDRAWYALADAKTRLEKAGQTEAQIAALDAQAGKRGLSPADDALLTLAIHLAASPVVLTDEEVAKAVELAGPKAVVQAVSYTTYRTMFNRFTEAARLPTDRP